MTRTLKSCALIALITCCVVPFDVTAQTYPTRPVRIVVGFSPGGGVDLSARAIAQQLTAALPQSVIVDNKPGAGGNIAADMVAKSPADGYTLLMANTTIATPSLFTSLPFDLNKDLLPVSLIALGPQVFAVQPSFPAKNARELIALAQSKPNHVLYGSAGMGTISHLEMELFASMAGISMVHVPYKGSAPGLVGLMSGEVQLIAASIPSALAHLASGKLRPIGISTLRRSSALPNVPTVDESGLPGFDAASWYGLFAPTGVSKSALDVLNREIANAMRAADVKEKFARDGFDPVGNTAAEFAGFIRGEVSKWEKVIKTRGIKAN